MSPNEYEALAAMKAATDPHLLELKAALRQRYGDRDADLLCRCLDNAYGHGFANGAIDTMKRAFEAQT